MTTTRGAGRIGSWRPSGYFGKHRRGGPLRILLVQPGEQTGLQRALGIVEPLGLEAIGAALAQAHEVRLLDLRLSPPAALHRAVHSFKPDACGISSTFTCDYSHALSVAQRIRQLAPNAWIFVGGHHPSLHPEDFYLPCVDALVIGEGEVTAREMVDCLTEGSDLRTVPGLALNQTEGQALTPARRLATDLDALPEPARWLIERYRRHYRLTTRSPVVSVETARGCPYRCKFCSVWRFYRRRVRVKCPEKVAFEVERVKGRDVFFTDDNFFFDPDRARELATTLRRHCNSKRYIAQTRSDSVVAHPELFEFWRKTGLDSLFLGFEKPGQEGLDSLAKANTVRNNEEALRVLRRLGIEPTVSFIVDPAYERHDFAFLKGYIRKLKIRYPLFTVLTPLPGTALFDELKDRLTSRDYSLYDLVHPVLPTRLPTRDFVQEFAGLYRAAYPRLRMLWEGLGEAIRRPKWFLSPACWSLLRTWRRLKDPRCYLRTMQPALEPSRGASV